MTLNMHEKGFTISKTILCLQASNLAPKLGRRRSAWQLARSSSSVAILNKICRQIKPGIVKLTTRRGQSNFSIAFICVSGEEKGYYRVVSVGQLSFDCRSYMQATRTAGAVAVCKVCFMPSLSTWPMWSPSAVF